MPKSERIQIGLTPKFQSLVDALEDAEREIERLRPIAERLAKWESATDEYRCMFCGGKDGYVGADGVPGSRHEDSCLKLAAVAALR